jgi:mono/diheme cytochrome c family protein
MKRSAWNVTLATALLMLAIASPLASRGAIAQQAEQALNDKQITGRTLFAQSCVVCHVKVQLTNVGHYGPVLSGMSLGGQEDLMREFISSGTPNMPGFKYHFRPDQIDAIVAYLKTLPVPAPATPAPANQPH